MYGYSQSKNVVRKRDHKVEVARAIRREARRVSRRRARMKRSYA